ncbi:MAG: 2-C-methyl-D-erythritol 2,4-cyclodiphosphate synthase [Oscillospiraceae bacterium]|jgi:2-C-methyl-D-erythritol 2,4-cyclodiphosphate synthase|nr:2-C-methyl-D-erythritol 2,4-cyclodiphosphate synthase [Oscillospiraceae bacterium]
MRIGFGYDAHRLVAGRAMVLCGVTVPSDFGPDGHSDADVAVHALCDAILGALALGDIGKHFPDTDERYRGVSSLVLLRECYAMARERGYTLGNCDITIVLQAPKLAPHIELMRTVLAATLSCDIDRVSVKATTEEHMGFTGSGEGISATAAVAIDN